MNPRAIPIPERLSHRPVDPRGYAIPWIVLHDTAGNPQFAINDSHLRGIALDKDLCHICGTGLFRGRWFVGGPVSALHPNGAFYDGGMHDECAHYALAVCPYLAAPRYAKRLDDARMRPEDAPEGLVTIDTTMLPDRPPVFVAVMSIGQRRVTDDNVLPTRPYRRIEFWRHGQKIDEGEGGRLAMAHLQSQGQQIADLYAAPPKAPRLVRHGRR